ncbi:cell division protein FtsN [Marinobacterium halophilum]|uniref:Cell division protein FtsN n=1 Tax=Marinobacterium halophilum TaxID=267374 RepID=A0A2P8EX88_9GAMM|nr:SPOR domain-containing protein [Marinobacterium halophilum]PSL14078.1 cell division protein FtsN [Marinobacterium halophilum]
MAKQDFARKRRSGNSASRKPARPAPRQPAPKRAAPPPRRRTPWGLLLATPLVLGGFGYLLYTLLQTPPAAPAASVTPGATSAKLAPAPTPTPKPKPVAAPEPKQSKFEFYEMLPKTEVVAPKVDVYKSTPKDAKMEHLYLLQAGSFRDPGDAERMRAKLILQGFPGVRSDRSEGSNGTWYRVRIGPFDNKTQMNLARNKLGKLNIIPMPIRID